MSQRWPSRPHDVSAKQVVLNVKFRNKDLQKLLGTAAFKNIHFTRVVPWIMQAHQSSLGSAAGPLKLLEAAE